MQISGIISEFNPFHKGHEYLISQAKKNSDGVICVMSGNFVQRGDTAIFPKFDRAKAAVLCGADLVLELPTVWAMSTAQNFALGAVDILKNTGLTDKIFFGSESANIEKLKKVSCLLRRKDFDNAVSSRLKTGKTFAKIRQEVLEEFYPEFADVLSNPNDTLATEYINAAARLNFPVDFECTKRIGAAHDDMSASDTVSGSFIRSIIKKSGIFSAEQYMPSVAAEVFKNSPVSDVTRLYSPLIYALRSDNSHKRYKKLPDISEGLENKIAKAVVTAKDYGELIDNIKSKRYTEARIRRILLNALLNADSEFQKNPVPYIRVLALSGLGNEILRKISKTSPLPVITTAKSANNLSENGKKIWNFECRATDIYSLSLNIPQECGMDYKQKLFKGDLENV